MSLEHANTYLRVANVSLEKYLKSCDFVADEQRNVLFEIYSKMFCDHLFTDVGREICTMEYK